MIAQIAPCWTFGWWEAVQYKEGRENAFMPEKVEGTEETLKKLADVKAGLSEVLRELPAKSKGTVYACLVGIRGMELFQKVGALLGARKFQIELVVDVDAKMLASELEEWFMYYKEMWRSIGQEGELYRIQNGVFWYADLLRS